MSICRDNQSRRAVEEVLRVLAEKHGTVFEIWLNVKFGYVSFNLTLITVAIFICFVFELKVCYIGSF